MSFWNVYLACWGATYALAVLYVFAAIWKNGRGTFTFISWALATALIALPIALGLNAALTIYGSCNG